MMKAILKKVYLIGSIAVLYMIVSTATVAQAKIRKFIASVAVSDNLLYIGESGGRIDIVDMKKLSVVERPSIYAKDGNVQSMKLINDNGRILAISVWDIGLRRAIFEITPEGDVKKIGIIPGRFSGLDNRYFYSHRYIQEEFEDRYKAFENKPKGHYEGMRFDKDLQNPQKGQIPGHPDLIIWDQAEDANNYYFFCSLNSEFEGTKRGFALVTKSKVTDQLEVSRFEQSVEWTGATQDKEWIKAEMTCDQDSLWFFLYSKNSRLIHYSKWNKELTVTPYLGIKGLIRNLSTSELPAFTYVGDASNQLIPMSHDAVEQQTAIDAFQHVFSKPLSYNRWSITYGGYLWTVARSYDDDDSIFHVKRVDLASGDSKVLSIRATFGDKVAFDLIDIKNGFEGLLFIIFGE